MRNGIFLIMALAMAGCRTQGVVEVPAPMVTRDTLKCVVVRVDSVHVADSVVLKGDTVERWHTRYVQRIMHDTVYKHRVDTVTKVETVTKEVERKGTNWLEWAGLASIAAALLWLAGRIRR